MMWALVPQWVGLGSIPSAAAQATETSPSLSRGPMSPTTASVVWPFLMFVQRSMQPRTMLLPRDHSKTCFSREAQRDTGEADNSLVNRNDHAWTACPCPSGTSPASAATGVAAELLLFAGLRLCDIWKVWRAQFLPVIAVAAATGLLCASNVSAAEPKRVLLIHSFGSAAPPFTVESMAFETELVAKMGERVDLDEVSLDMARYAGREMQEAIVDYLQERQAKWQPDLVVPIGSPAAIFVANYRDRLFPETPILYTSLDRRLLPPGALENNAAYVGQVYELPGLLEDMLQIAPATKNIVVVVGATPLEHYWQEAFRQAIEPYKGRINVTYYGDLSFDQMLERVSTLPPDSYIFFLLLLRDAAGVTLNGDEALQSLHKVARAPINGIFDHQMGLGIVGGRLYQSARVGRESAEVASRILHGEPASSFLPRLVERLPPRYDWRELNRWKISKSRLPRESTIVYQTPTLWQRRRGLILGIVIVCGLQALLITGLLANLVKRRRAERSLRQAEEEAHHHREQINLLSRVSLLGEMTAALAHELNQPLSAIISDAKAGMRFIDKGKEDPKTLREILAAVVADGYRAHEIIQNVRNTIKKGDTTRHRISLNELVTRVADVVRPDAVAHSCEVETSLASDLPPIEGDSVQIQQVLVNLVSNAFDAMQQTPPDQRKVEISTAGDGDGKVHLSVRDHGTGIRTEVHERLFDQFFTTKENGLGMGLAIVRSIVEAHGGQIDAENVAEGGARFYFTLPVAAGDQYATLQPSNLDGPKVL
jgi:signal transduction histidine kinase